MTVAEANATIRLLRYLLDPDNVITAERAAADAAYLVGRAQRVLLAGLAPDQVGKWVEERAARLRDAEAERDALRAEVERLRAELTDLQGQNALTEHHFTNYVDDAIREQNTLRERVAVAERDAARWRRVELFLACARRKGVRFLYVDDLLDAAQDAEPGADDGTCGDCATGKCHGTTPDDCDCDRHDASTPEATP